MSMPRAQSTPQQQSVFRSESSLDRNPCVVIEGKPAVTIFPPRFIQAQYQQVVKDKDSDFWVAQSPTMSIHHARSPSRAADAACADSTRRSCSQRSRVSSELEKRPGAQSQSTTAATQDLLVRTQTVDQDSKITHPVKECQMSKGLLHEMQKDPQELRPSSWEGFDKRDINMRDKFKAEVQRDLQAELRSNEEKIMGVMRRDLNLLKDEIQFEVRSRIEAVRSTNQTQQTTLTRDLATVEKDAIETKHELASLIRESSQLKDDVANTKKITTDLTKLQRDLQMEIETLKTQGVSFGQDLQMAIAPIYHLKGELAKVQSRSRDSESLFKRMFGGLKEKNVRAAIQDAEDSWNAALRRSLDDMKGELMKLKSTYADISVHQKLQMEVKQMEAQGARVLGTCEDLACQICELRSTSKNTEAALKRDLASLREHAKTNMHREVASLRVDILERIRQSAADCDDGISKLNSVIGESQKDMNLLKKTMSEVDEKQRVLTETTDKLQGLQASSATRMDEQYYSIQNVQSGYHSLRQEQHDLSDRFDVSQSERCTFEKGVGSLRECVAKIGREVHVLRNEVEDIRELASQDCSMTSGRNLAANEFDMKQDEHKDLDTSLVSELNTLAPSYVVQQDVMQSQTPMPNAVKSEVDLPQVGMIGSSTDLSTDEPTATSLSSDGIHITGCKPAIAKESLPYGTENGDLMNSQTSYVGSDIIDSVVLDKQSATDKVAVLSPMMEDYISNVAIKQGEKVAEQQFKQLMQAPDSNQTFWTEPQTGDLREGTRSSPHRSQVVSDNISSNSSMDHQPAKLLKHVGQQPEFFTNPPHPTDEKSRAITLEVEQLILDNLKRPKEEKRKLIDRKIPLKVHPDKGAPRAVSEWFDEWKKAYLEWFLED